MIKTALWIGMVAMTAARTGPLCAQEAPPTEPITFGMSTALGGPAAQLGSNMRLGVEAAFADANRSGGVRGAPVRLVALDDGYEPDRTIPNMHRLIGEEGVVAVIGNVGTPTAIAAIPIANANRTLLFGSFTGAGVLRRTPPDRYVINYRASYAEETAAMVDALMEHTDLKPDEIAFFTQRDGYGDAGYAGGIAALKGHGLPDGSQIAHGRYERNTLAVENGLADVLGADPQPRAVIMVGAYEPCAEFVRVADQFEFRPVFLNVSFVGSQALASALGPVGDGVIVTQVVPPPESDLPICVEYRRALADFDPDAPLTYTSLEGYIAGIIVLQALRGVEGPITREAVVDALDAMGEFDIGLGIPLRLEPDNHQASHTVWPTIIRGGRVVPFEWSALREMVEGGGP